MSLKAIGSVTLLNVDDGSQGEQGLSVSKVSTQYYLSTSPTSLTGGSWVDTQPKITTGKYLWERNKTTLSDNSVVYSDAYYAQTISGLVSDVDNVKGQITNKVWQSDITTSINSYDNTTVSTIRDRVSTTEQNLTGITTRVGAVESTTGSLGTRMTAAESSISQNADNIALKVSKDGVISSINQSPESITISADKVNIAGSTAFTSLNSQVTAIQNETNQKSELIRGTQTAATYSWTGTSTTISQLTDGMEIRYWLPFSVAGGTVSGSYSYYDGSKTTTGTNTGVGLTLTLKDGTMTEEIPVYYGSMTRLTSHYGYGNIIRMIYRENVRVNNGNSTYYTVAKGFWCDANYNANSSYTQYSYWVTSGANNSVYKYSLLMRDSANTWVSIATSDGTGTSKSAYTGGLYYDKVLYHDSGTNYASNKTTGAVYDSIPFDLRYSTNCGTTLTNRKPVYLVGTINNTDKRFYLDTTQWYTQTVPTSADGKTYIYIGEAYSSYQVWLATENKAYQYYNGRFITLEEIKDLEVMSWINSTGQNAADIIANWATDATSATTTINGGLIQTHTIQASHLATNAIMSNNYQASQNAGSPYSVTGSFLDLDNGNFYTPNFGLDNVNGNAYFNGEITATSGQIGDDTSNYWQIGTVVDFNGNQSAAIESNGTSYIQSGDWMISNDRIDTRHYDNQRKYTYLYEDGVYWDFGLHTPSLTSNNDYENNFIYIRNHESTIPTLEGAWNYVFRVDRNGMIYINGVSLDDKYASIDGVSGAYLPMTGGSLTGNLSVGGNLTVTGTVSGLKNLSINGKTYNGSSAVTVGTIGAAYGGTGQTSLINSANALINALDTGSSTPVDNDYYISQYVNGGTTTKTYHRRPMSALWLYIKGKINADTNLYTDKFVPKTGGEFTGAVTVSDALIADEITSGNLIVNGVGRFTNGIYGDLTGDVVGTASKAVGDENGLNIASNYLRLSGGTMTGHLTVPTIKVNSIVNEGYAHRIDFGRPSVNQMDFYEYGGVFNFYWNTSTTSTENATLLGKITTNGWEGNVVGNVTGNASTATKATQDSDGNTISSTYVKKSGDTMTGVLTLKGNLYTDGYAGGLNANNSNIYGVNGIYFADTTDSPGEYINFYRDSTHVDSLYASSGKLYFSPNRELTKTGSIYKVLIEGDTIPESSLIWGNKAFTADYSMGDVFLNDYLRANRFAGVKASAITIEYSSDGGSTWNDYQTNDLLKRSLFTTSSGYHIGGSSSGTVTANSQLRITLDFTEGSIYTNLRKIMIYVSTNYSQNCKVTITASKGTSPNDYSLIVCENQSIAGWSGWNIIPCNFNTYGNTDSANSQYQRIRFVFTNSGLSDTSRKGGLQICRIYGYGGVGWSTPSNLALTGHVYTYDGNLNATFPAQITATQFNGNATSASKLNSTRSFTIGKTAKNVDWSGAVSFSQAEISDNASTSAAGWMSKDDKTKLNGIEANAQVNTITGVKGDSESSYRTGNVNITASNIGLGNLTNNKQVKGLSSGTTSGHLVTWGSDGYTVADSGITAGNVVKSVASNSDGKLVLTYADNTTSDPIDVEFVATETSSVSKAEALNVNGTAVGSATVPVYFDNKGKPQTANTIPKLNNATTGGTFYAPTGTGTSGQILQSSGGTPTWVNLSTVNTTYTIATGDSNGQIKVTPSSGNAYNVGVKGLGTAAFANTTLFPIVSTYILAAGKAVRIQYPTYVPVLISAQRSNSGGRLILLGGGYGAQGTVRNDFQEVVSSNVNTFTWTLPSSSSISNSIEIMNVNTSGNATITVWSSSTATFTEIDSLSDTAMNKSIITSTDYTDYTVTKTGAGASGTWGINITGNAATATKFSSNRSIALTGDVTGSASSNGENGWSIATTVGDDSHNHTEFTLVPKTHKTYESTSYYATATTWDETSWFFFSVRPDSWTKPWKIKFKIRSYCPDYTNVDSITESVIHGRADSITYSNFTEKYDNGHYYIPVYPLKKAGYDAGYGHAIGVSIYYGTSYTNSAYYRTFELDYYSCENCTVTILDTPVKWVNWTGTGSTNYGSISGLDATTRGYTESGDRNDPSYQQREYYASRTAYKFLGRYQLLLTRPDGKVFPVNTTDNNISTTKTYDTDTEFDPFGQIFYNYTGGTTAINTNVGNDRLYNQVMMDLRYAFNVGGNGTTSLITARQPFYLVATPQSNGMAKIHSSGFTQTLPTSDDGLIYIYLGTVYEDTNPYRLNLTLHHPIYWYKNGAIRQYVQRAEIANTANNATNATTATNATNATNLLAYAGNEVTIGANSATRNECTNDKVYINYRDVGNGSSSNTSTAITDYYFCDRKGSTDEVSIHAGTFIGSLSGTATKATQDGSGNTITSYYVTLSTNQTISGAKTFSSAVTFANNTWNLMGDDAYIGDCNAAGRIGIKGKNGATGVRFVPYSGSTNNDITIDGTGNLTATGNLIQQGTVTVGSHAKLAYNESLECLEFSFV